MSDEKPGMSIPWKTLFWAGTVAGLMWWAIIYGVGIWLFW
jgi:hypothetical protein